MREFLISVASGLTVALLSALFIRQDRRGGQSQTMNINTSRRGPWGVLVYVLLGAAAAALVFLYLRGGFSSQ